MARVASLAVFSGRVRSLGLALGMTDRLVRHADRRGASPWCSRCWVWLQTIAGVLEKVCFSRVPAVLRGARRRSQRSSPASRLAPASEEKPSVIHGERIRWGACLSSVGQAETRGERPPIDGRSAGSVMVVRVGGST